MTTLFDLSEHTIDMVPGQPEKLINGMTVRISSGMAKDDFRDGVVVETDNDGIVWAKFDRLRPHPATNEKTVVYPVHVPNDLNFEQHNPVLAWKR